MFLQDRINCLTRLGERIKNLSDDEMGQLIQHAGNENAWFTDRSVRMSLKGISKFLEEKTLTHWTSQYGLGKASDKKIGVIAAGNIPCVGFHDLLCVLLAGHRLMLKPSSDDQVLMQFLIDELIQLAPDLKDRIEIVERLNQTDAYIGTGSDNSARYFKYYFKDKPHIIRSNRTSVAVVNGQETTEDFEKLGQDIFEYYGLGCRNVSKLFVPKDYDLKILLDALASYEFIGEHYKYRNNYDYNKSIYLVNKEPHLDNGFVLLRESDQLVSPISVLYYEYYDDESHLETLLSDNSSKIQCTVGADFIPFGQAQFPEVTDYADGVDTLAFLVGL